MLSEIIFCVVLYNKKIEDSLTCQSLISLACNFGCDFKVIVFNNGPNLVSSSSDIIFVNQVLVNASLSKIYNAFIRLYPSERYVFLDDDTLVGAGYFNELLITCEKILIPRVFCNGDQEYPIFKKGRVQSITSGLMLSNEFCKVRLEEGREIFDERFDLYGVDTYFFYDLNKYKYNYRVSEEKIEHDLSHVSSGSNEFRGGEVLLANSAALLPYFNFRLLLVVVLGNFRMLKRMRLKVIFSSFCSIFLKRVIRLWRY